MISHEATVYVDTPLMAPKTPPVGSTVDVAFVAPGTRPVAGSFHPATWVVADSGRTVARILVGPGGAVTLAAPAVDVWLRIDATPEVAWIYAGRLSVG